MGAEHPTTWRPSAQATEVEPHAESHALGGSDPVLPGFQFLDYRVISTTEYYTDTGAEGDEVTSLAMTVTTHGGLIVVEANGNRQLSNADHDTGLPIASSGVLQWAIWVNEADFGDNSAQFEDIVFPFTAIDAADVYSASWSSTLRWYFLNIKPGRHTFTFLVYVPNSVELRLGAPLNPFFVSIGEYAPTRRE